MVPGRRERYARLLPAAGRLRQLPMARAVRERLEHHLGRARAHRRYAGRHERRAHAGWLAGACDRLGRQRRLPRRSSTQGSDRRLLLWRGRRAHRAPPPSGEERRPDAAQERLSAVGVHPLDRSALPSCRPHHCAGRDDVHHRHVPRHHPGIAVVGPRHLSAPADRSVRARQGRQEGPYLAAVLRRHAAPYRRRRACSAKHPRNSCGT